KSGNTAVIGGMLHRDEIESLAKVPILGEIPLLGELFKKRSTTTENTEIVVMITAWQVNPGQRPAVGPATSGEKFPIKLEDAPTK
ncbi:MAG TPA: type II and III secretion system protein family protein, partial [Bacillota bacterium]|nr:type II and III secretion system protein family protein [Bacillota bacterium]